MGEAEGRGRTSAGDQKVGLEVLLEEGLVEEGVEEQLQGRGRVGKACSQSGVLEQREENEERRYLHSSATGSLRGFHLELVHKRNQA